MKTITLLIINAIFISFLFTFSVYSKPDGEYWRVIIRDSLKFKSNHQPTLYQFNR